MYKLVGPVLVKQEQAEAKSNVDKRLEFIKGEMCVYYKIHFQRILLTTLRRIVISSKRVETQIKDLGEKADKKKSEVRIFCTAHSSIVI